MKKQALATLLAISLLGAVPFAAVAAPQKWINVNVHDDQEASGSLFNSENYDFTKYSAIASILQSYAKQSNRVKVDVTGKSADGRELYAVTISAGDESGNNNQQGNHERNQTKRKQMFNSVDQAQSWIDKNKDFKVPIMINSSIHGTEFVGTDATLKLIKRFAFDNDATTTNILDNNILIFNVVANPDGRVEATRFNGNGIDLNRDFITQSQPETKATVDLITKWNPMVLLDLHGYVRDWYPNSAGLIEPCTPPHNPNYEYDLYDKWAIDQAKAMEQEILADKASFTGDRYKQMQGVYIPARPLAGQDTEGWDDYPPIFTPMYAMYHGAYGHTMEAPTNDLDGVQWQYDGVMGALKFATANKDGMIKDQIEMFKRGINFDHPYHQAGFFPNDYILPVNPNDPTVTIKAVNHLIANDIQVEVAKQPFTAEGKTYPAGTYLLPMNQAKAGLANTMLWAGEDISQQASAMYDISAWSLPELWGFEAIPTHSSVTVNSSKVNKLTSNGSLLGKGPYVIPNSSVQAVQLVNSLVNQGLPVKRDVQGNFFVYAKAGNKLRDLVQQSGLALQTGSVPANAQSISKVKVAILKDGGIWKQQSHSGTKLALERLGFQVTEVAPSEVANQGIGSYDVFIFSGTKDMILPASEQYSANKDFGLANSDEVAKFKQQVTKFVGSGKKYIAVGAEASIATKSLGLTSVTVNTGNPTSNGIVKVQNFNSPLTAGYKQSDYGFVFAPVWYTDTEKASVAAAFANSTDFFTAGHWRDRADVPGKAVIVKEKDKDVTLIGLEAGFRDHTDYLYRLFSNAIFN